MQTIVIFGAGQFGRRAAGLLNTNELSLIAFGDNNPGLWGSALPCLAPGGQAREIPVLPPGEAVALKPELILIGVTDQVRGGQLRAQALELGFSGEFVNLGDLYRRFDIRGAVLAQLAARLQAQDIPGAVAELGVYRGDTAWKLNALFPERPLYLFDTFEGFDSRDIRLEKDRDCSRAREGEFSDTSEAAVLGRLPWPLQALVKKGYFPETAAGLEDERFALVSLDADLYAPILAGLEFFYPRLSRGGMILLHDYGNERFRGAGQAVAAWEAVHGPLLLLPLCDLHGSAVIIRP